jgi:gentisate 1,2-dioxygenase
MHRITRGTSTVPRRQAGSAVYQVFDGGGRVTAGDLSWSVSRGDLFVVPSWTSFSVASEADALDLFTFSDAPIFEALRLDRSA